MKYDSEKLTAEINDKLDGLILAGEPLRAQFIAHAVCQEHADGLAKNDHSDFWRHGGYKTCRDEVRRCINRRIGDKPETDKQLVFDGFEHLQRFYVVERHGDQIGIPVQELSDDEIETKAALYRSMGAACYAHADELDRFRHWRRSPSLSDAAPANEMASA